MTPVESDRPSLPGHRMTYQAPVEDIAFTLRHAAGMGDALTQGLYGDLDAEVIEAVLGEAGKFASDVIAPLNKVGDSYGTPFKDGAVTMPPGWKEAYTAWAAAGWNGLAAPENFGGQALPHAVNAACTEMWNAASMAFGIGALRTRAERAGDGTYKLTGQKIFITYGEHDLTDNIVHLVLARLPDAPAGTRGISLFLVPKFLVNADGSLGARNDVRCHSIEHKLGIHGSPTCTMVFGDQGGATAYLIGEENRGLACMFTMMNLARLSVGLQGVGVAERATQQALQYARERKQGRALGATVQGSSAIIEHPDVKRMLMTMRALTRAAR